MTRHRAGMLILGLVIVGGAAVLGWLHHAHQRALDQPLIPAGAEAQSYVLEPGTSLVALAGALSARGWLDEPRTLIWEGRRRGVASRLQAGEYAIEPGMTPRELLEAMVAGRIVQHQVTLLEGWTFRQALEALHGHPELEATLSDASFETIMARLDREGQHPEGLFYPDTYHFSRGTSDLDILRRALNRMEQVLQRSWSERRPDLPLDEPYEALVLASIVEKETGAAEERPIIAGVFIRRLRIGMRLQTDPTVIYGMGEAFDGDLRRRDLRADTPYNTYRRDGLPPTPIALAGEAAIDAVLNPTEGEALFFVARGDGTHAFSATLAEHNRAVACYQLGRASKCEPAAAAEDTQQ